MEKTGCRVDGMRRHEQSSLLSTVFTETGAGKDVGLTCRPDWMSGWASVAVGENENKGYEGDEGQGDGLFHLAPAEREQGGFG